VALLGAPRPRSGGAGEWQWAYRGVLGVMLVGRQWHNACTVMQLLEECNPIVLILILMLVLVGQLPPELVVVKIDFTSFLIFYSSFTKLLYS
jgi:hypothetical protein